MPPAANANRILTAAWLQRRYVDERAPVETVAADAGCDPATVYRALTRYGIPHRGTQRPSWGDILTQDFLSPRLAAGWSLAAIARDAVTAAGGGRCSHSTVVWWAAKRGLLTVEDPRADRAVGLYRDDDWPLRGIATELGVSPRRVTIWLMARGVELFGPGAPLQGE